jgi:hypothetical protein
LDATKFLSLASTVNDAKIWKYLAGFNSRVIKKRFTEKIVVYACQVGTLDLTSNSMPNLILRAEDEWYRNCRVRQQVERSHLGAAESFCFWHV